MRRQSITCETCGADVESMEAHLEKIAKRRALYGDAWQLEVRQRFTVNDFGDTRGYRDDFDDE